MIDGSPSSAEAAAPVSPDAILSMSIGRRRCVNAVYNRTQVVLAPYMLFARHGDLHVAALTVARDGQAPKEAKVGVFKVSGLRELQASNRLFSPRRDLMAGLSEEHVLAKVGD